MAKYSQYACYFNGTDEYIGMGDVLGFERTDAFSISLWFTANAAARVLVSKMGEAPGYAGWKLGLDSGLRLAFSLYSDFTGSDRLEVRTTETWYNRNWAHLVVAYDGSSTAAGVTIYLNGEAVPTTVTYNSLGSSIITAASMEIGRRSTSTDHQYWYQSYIDDVGIYAKELSLAEVAWIYNGNAPRALDDVGAPSDLVGCWLMGDGASPPTMPDTSVSGYDGTMVNMTAGNFTRFSAGAQDAVSMDPPDPSFSTKFVTCTEGVLLPSDAGDPQRIIQDYFLMRGWNTSLVGWEMWISQDAPDPVPPIGPCVNVTVAASWEVAS